jgi:hypothetical protein
LRLRRVVCRYLLNNDFTGPLPTELGTLDALTELCVRRPHPSRADTVLSPGCGLSAAAAWGCRRFDRNGLTGPLPTQLGTLTAVIWLCVRRPHHRAWTCAPSPGCGLSAAVVWGSRHLYSNSFTGPLPTELGAMDALINLCVHRPHPPCLDACAFKLIRLASAVMFEAQQRTCTRCA